jgi:two-component system LytT family response regulator
MTERLRVLIVDDEPLARAAVRDVLRTRDDVEIIAECGSGEEALASVSALRPDLMFLDIRMPGLDGFAVVRALDSAAAPLVVFVTAFDQHAIDAFELEAVDYVLKPFEDDRLHRAVERAKGRSAGERAAVTEALRAVLDRITPRGEEQFLAGGVAGTVIVVQASAIHYADAADNYVRLHTSQGVRLLRETLSALETRLDPSRFARVHRSFIVDLRRVRELKPLPSGDYELQLEDGAAIPMSRTYRDAVFRRLGRKGRSVPLLLTGSDALAYIPGSAHPSPFCIGRQPAHQPPDRHRLLHRL